MSTMRSEHYSRGYFENGEGSNYHEYGDDPGWPVVLNAIENWFVPGDKLVEAACAKGWFVRHARQRGYNAFGFDISEYAINSSTTGAKPYIHVHNAAEKWRYPDLSMDAVFAFEFFEHVPEDEVQLVLAEMLRVLKTSGKLILKTGIVVPDDFPFAEQEDHDVTHVTMRDRQWWNNTTISAGFAQSRDDTHVIDNLDAAFKGRDWAGRFFAYHKPDTGDE